MATHDVRHSISSAIVSGELFRSESNIHDEASDTIQHVRRHLTDAEISVLDHQDVALQLERDMNKRDTLRYMTEEQLEQEFETAADVGLRSDIVQARAAKHGPNELDRGTEVPVWKMFVLQFLNVIILLLLFACVASFALGEWIEGLAVIIIVLLNATIAVVTERGANEALKKLSGLSQASTHVRRDGKVQSLSTRELVPGDVVVLGVGDVVPADIRLLRANDMKVNEMLLTGEAIDVRKNGEVISRTTGDDSKVETLTPANEVFSSTTVVNGSGEGIVVATGMNTRVGRIAALVQQGGGGDTCLGIPRAKRTPLQMKLHRLGLTISCVAIVACATVFTIGTARGYEDADHPDNPAWVQMVLVAVSLAVSAIPEGLPLCVTICLAIGTKEMAQRNALIRQLPAVETLGSAQIICTDKTGTITTGQMTAVKLWFSAAAPGETVEITGHGMGLSGSFVHPSGKLAVGDLEESDRPHAQSGSGVLTSSSNILLGLAALNSTAKLTKQLKQAKDDNSGHTTPISKGDLELARSKQFDANHKLVPTGNLSEVPMLVAAAKAGVLASDIQTRFRPLSYKTDEAGTVEHDPEVPFSSARKAMASVHSVVSGDDPLWQELVEYGIAEDEHEYVSIVKGAPNIVIDRCSHILHDGTTAPLSPELRQTFDAAVDRMSSQALRVLAVAVRTTVAVPYDTEDTEVSADDKYSALAQQLVLVGLVGSIDPEREGVKASIARARGAGVRTVMITGDYLKTAIAIARNIDLLQLQDDILESAVDCAALRPDNEYLADVDMDELTSRCLVFARAQPEDKLRIVQSLRRQGFVSAMTGDGVNDAPALVEADIGVAMAITGTDVAKGAADMVLLDDDFCTIVEAIAKGRKIYRNIQKFVTYLLGTNATQVLLILICVIVGLPVPLQPLPILFLNLMIDGAPAMSISAEVQESWTMDVKPRPPQQPIIFGRMWSHIFVHAGSLTAAALVSFALGLYWHTGQILIDDLLPDGGNLVCEFLNTDGEWIVNAASDCAAVGIRKARTMAFITVVTSEIMRAFTVRTSNPFYHGMTKNKPLLAAVSLSSVLAVCAIAVPGLRSSLFNFEGLEWHVILLALGLTLVPFVSDELLKWAHRLSTRHDERWQGVNDKLERLWLEMRNLRHRLDPAPQAATVSAV